jgi:hypothetical protein
VKSWRYHPLPAVVPFDTPGPPYLFQLRDELHNLGGEGWELLTVNDRRNIRELDRTNAPQHCVNPAVHSPRRSLCPPKMVDRG